MSWLFVQEDEPIRNRIPSPQVKMLVPRWVIGGLALLLTCATLVAGISPFRPPDNEVTFPAGKDAVRFGSHGTALSSGVFQLAGDGSGGSIELWVEPAKTWARGSVLSFYGFSKNRQFKLEQDYPDLRLQLGDCNEATTDKCHFLPIGNVFRQKQAFITVTSDRQGTSVYIDGQLADRSQDFKLSGDDLSGKLILANSPFRNHSWQGEIKGLAIYGSALDAAQIQQHYRNWTERGEPMPDNSGQMRALFLFRERGGNIIHNAVPGEPDLEVPARFLVVDHLRFESPLSEYRSEPTYLENAEFNIAGFIPLGLMVSYYLASVRKIKRATLLTVLAGAAVSLTIEYSQSFLPTRFSGCTDLFTNTLGTWIGAMLQKLVARWIAIA
jgi:VanZ family protein